MVAAHCASTGQVSLDLRPLSFCTTWLLLVLLHAACAGFLVLLLLSHFSLADDDEKDFYISLWSDADDTFFKVAGILFGILGALHVLQILRLIVLSVLARRLVLHSEPSPSIHSTEVTPIAINSDDAGADVSDVAVNSAKSDSMRFRTLFAVRELMALGALTYQAYQFSRYLPRMPLNMLTALLLVATCCLTPVVQTVSRRSAALECVLGLSCSVVFAIALVVAVPLLLMLAYRADLDMTRDEFSVKLVYDPTFVAQLAPESRLVLAYTPVDLCVKLVPHISIILTLLGIEALVSPRSEKVAPQGGLAANGKPCPTPSCPWPYATFKLLSFVWGAVVLGLHLQAQLKDKPPSGCLSTTQPWLTANTSCLSFVYDCHAVGSTTPTVAEFDLLKLDTASLGMLGFVHCPGLIVPGAVQWFPNIYSLHVFNSTIYYWPADAAVTEKRHDRIVSVVLVLAVFADFPTGLRQELPDTMVNLQFFGTSLQQVPSDLGEQWGLDGRRIGRVGFEFSRLLSVPPEIFGLANTLSIMGNQLSELPALGETQVDHIPELFLDYNPILALPSTVNASLTIGYLSAETTGLSQLPAWTKTQVLTDIHLNGSVFCHFVTQEAARTAAQANCSSRHGTHIPELPTVTLGLTYPILPHSAET